MTFSTWPLGSSAASMRRMNECPRAASSRTGAGGFLASVWPVAQPGDSTTQRRKVLAVRGGYAAMAVMVLTGTGGMMIAGYRELSLLRGAVLVVGALVYVLWSLHGTRDAVRLLLWETGAPPPRLWPPESYRERVTYFAVQLGLAGLLYYLGGRGTASLVGWLVLLPPVAHSVILLPRTGVAIVSVLSVALLVFDQAWWHGWGPVPNALVGFLFAVVFTLVFTQLAVSSERSRAEVQRLAGELSEANRELREYAVQAEELAATRERNRLAREIHDTVGHCLTVVNVQLEAARALRERDPVAMAAALDKAQGLTQQGLQEIRRSVASLRGSPLDNKPLVEALRQVVGESQTAGLATELTVLGEARPLQPPANLALYRAGQEGLTNARKHAKAARARLVLDFRAPDKVCLSVSDDGVGSGTAAGAPTGFGLLGLRERVQLLGGELRVRTAPGAGFTLEVEVPA